MNRMAMRIDNVGQGRDEFDFEHYLHVPPLMDSQLSRQIRELSQLGLLSPADFGRGFTRMPEVYAPHFREMRQRVCS